MKFWELVPTSMNKIVTLISSQQVLINIRITEPSRRNFKERQRDIKVVR